MVRDDLGSRVETGLPALGWTVDLEVAFVALSALDFGLDGWRSISAPRCASSPLPERSRWGSRRICVGRLAAGERPVVGDWVALAGEPGGALVVQRLARRSTFARRRAGSEGAAREQVIAANVDTAFLVTDARDFSPRRIERYLAVAREASAEPVIVLTKLDLYPDLLDLVSELRALAPHVAVHPVSSETGEGFDRLDCYLEPGRTICLLGSSGVGKSTLANRLLGYNHLRTGAGAPQWRGTAHDQPP